MRNGRYIGFGFFILALAGVIAFFAFNNEDKEVPIPPEQNLEYKKAFTTVFWIGEGATKDSGFIPNHQSAWDSLWQEHYGGIDTPDQRCGYKPCGFEPKENPFYFALPYNDLGLGGVRKASAFLIPWFQEKSHQKSVIKNAWVEVVYGRKTCYAQWEDVGPSEMDDFDYVFGDQPPKIKAALDVSPAVRDCLNMKKNDSVFWKFVSDKEVPAGPWKEIITVRDVSW